MVQELIYQIVILIEQSAMSSIFGKILDSIIISNQTESLKHLLFNLDISITVVVVYPLP